MRFPDWNPLFRFLIKVHLDLFLCMHIDNVVSAHIDRYLREACVTKPWFGHNFACIYSSS